MPSVVSCAPIAYAEGGFYDDPERLEQKVDDLISDAGTEIFPSFTYERPFDEAMLAGAGDGGAKLRSHMDFVVDVFRSGPSTRLVKLRDVFLVEDRIAAIRNGATYFLAETVRAVDVEENSLDDLAPGWLLANATHVNAPNLLYVGSRGFANYGHWLLDDLPRLKAIAEIVRRSGRPVDVVLRQSGPQLDDVKEASIYLSTSYGEIASVSFAPRDRVLHFDDMWFVTSPTLHPALKSPDACRFLQGFADRVGGARKGAPTRLFVTRASDRGRVLVNQADLLDVLRTRDFATVDPGEMTFVEQVLAFSAARVIVGTMGAAMTNAVFAPRDAKLLFLAPDGWTEPFYWDLAAACGQDYRAIYGPSQPNCSPELRNFRINPAMFEQALERCLPSW